MAREFYNPQVKAAIIEAVVQARKAKKTWAEALVAAKAAGFAGSRIPNLMRMLGKSGKAKAKAKGRKRGRKPGRKPAAVPTKAKRGPGRPPQAKVAKPAGVGSIEAMIGKLVAQQVNAVLDKAIAVLQAAKQ